MVGYKTPVISFRTIFIFTLTFTLIVIIIVILSLLLIPSLLLFIYLLVLIIVIINIKKTVFEQNCCDHCLLCSTDFTAVIYVEEFYCIHEDDRARRQST